MVEKILEKISLMKDFKENKKEEKYVSESIDRS